MSRRNVAPTTKGQARTEAQRHRILNAAHKCFIERGFHAASMASIAETANMSAGLIYRYFENKNAIVLAIIALQLQERRTDIAALHSNTDLGQRIIELFARWQRGGSDAMNAALFLEMSAQATRDPQIADAVMNADHIAGADFNAWLKQSTGESGMHFNEDDIRWRAFALQCFVEGLAVRAVREPGLAPSVLVASVELFLSNLLSSQNRSVD